MAKVEFAVNHPLSNKIWAKGLFSEVISSDTWLGKFIGKSKDSLIVRKDELSKNAGDTVYQGLRVKLTGEGVSGDDTLEGLEEALTTYRDALVINQIRHATRSAGKMSEQRVNFDVRNENMEGLRDWYTERLETWFANHVCGNTAQTNTIYTGFNLPDAPSANNIIRPNGATTASSLSDSTTDRFHLSLIDACVTRANTMHQQATAQPIIRPLRINGESKYVMFLHDNQVRDLRTNTATGQWLDIEKSAMAGMNSSKSPIYTGALGEYNGVILHKWNYVTTDVSASVSVANTRRAVFCGAQAGLVAFGSENGVDKMTWVEKKFDYDNQLGVSAGLIGGLKKARFNSRDFGTIVVPTFAANS